MKLFKYSFFAVLLFALFGFIQPASALTVSPVVVDHEVAPGMRAIGKIMVTNESKLSEMFYVSVQSFVAKGEEGEQHYLDEEMDVNGLSKWFGFNEKSFILEAGKTKELEYTINIPTNAEPGGHYASVFFTNTPDTEGEGSALGISAKTGIVFLIKVSGEVNENATIESFTVNKSVFSSLPAMMSLRIRNHGSVHFRPTGTLTVRNMWGGIVARVPANPKKGAVLPNSVRRLDTWWAKSTDIATGGFIAGLTNEWRNFALGKYTATVDVKYGSANTPLEAQNVSFWVIPWRMGLVFLLAILLLLLIMKFYNRAIVNSAINKNSKRKK